MQGYKKPYLSQGLLVSKFPSGENLSAAQIKTEMKLSLLLVLVVAALLPDLSESRIVSKCELKNKLGEKINLHKRFRKHKEEILSIIICEMSRKSSLNTSLVNVDGIRLPLFTTQPITEEPGPETDLPMTAAPTAPATTTTTTTTASTTTTSTTTTTTTTSPISTAASVGGRKKRRAPPRRRQDTQETLNDMENTFDEEEMEKDDERMSKENSSEENKSHERKPNKITFWSLGYYGIFQLRDSLFCDSGYRWSKNLCNKSCSDFTDDDITDDIECLINSHYHWYLFRSLSHECFNQRNSFLQDCS